MTPFVTGYMFYCNLHKCTQHIVPPHPHHPIPFPSIEGVKKVTCIKSVYNFYDFHLPVSKFCYLFPLIYL